MATVPAPQRPRPGNRHNDQFARALICTYAAVILAVAVIGFLVGFLA